MICDLAEVLAKFPVGTNPTLSPTQPPLFLDSMHVSSAQLSVKLQRFCRGHRSGLPSLAEFRSVAASWRAVRLGPQAQPLISIAQEHICKWHRSYEGHSVVMSTFIKVLH